MITVEWGSVCAMCKNKYVMHFIGIDFTAMTLFWYLLVYHLLFLMLSLLSLQRPPITFKVGVAIFIISYTL
jgi:hypothetical protein